MNNAQQPISWWRRVGIMAIGVCLGATIGLAPTTAQAKPAEPQLSIAVDNGTTSAKTGDQVTYTITVTNLGGADLAGLLVTQSLPAGTTLTSAKPEVAPRQGNLEWKLKLKATKKATFTTTLTVATTPDQLLRLATVACARISAKGPAIVCASDSDQLPAGAAAAAEQAEAAASGDTASAGQVWWYAGGGLVAVAVAGLALLVLRRRRLARST